MGRILVVDDDRANIELLSEILAKEGHSIQSAKDGETALHRIKAWKPQLMLLDANLPGVSGVELIQRIRQDSVDDYVSIILLTTGQDVEDSFLGLETGADDYITKPFRPQQLIGRVRSMLRFKEAQDALRKAAHRIDELTTTDDLTGLLNMRTLHRKGEEEILKARRFKKPVSALIINLDQFSAINHQLGFSVGSIVIQEVANRIRSSIRSIDMAARVGADEFFLLLVESDLASAEFMAERIRDAIQSVPFKDAKHSTSVTACIGVAGLGPEDKDQQMSDLFHSASEALRSAKAAGPNHIEIYSFA